MAPKSIEVLPSREIEQDLNVPPGNNAPQDHAPARRVIKPLLKSLNLGRKEACLNFNKTSRRNGHAEYSGVLCIGAEKVEIFQDLYANGGTYA